MVYNPTEWKDKIVENPMTFDVQNNADGSITLVPKPGAIIQAGTPVNAANLNNLETQYEKALADMKPNIDKLDYNVYNLMLQMYYDGKIIPKQGLMFDGLSDNLKLDQFSAIVMDQANAGTDTISLSTVSGLSVGMLLILNDLEVSEEKVVTAINGNNVQFATSLQNTFSIGSRATRTFGMLDTASKKLKGYSYFESNLGGLEALYTGSYSWHEWGYPGAIGLGDAITLPTNNEPYYITKVNVKISQKNSPGGNLFVTLHSSPGGPVLATSVSRPASAANGDWVSFAFTTPCKYSGGQILYAMVNRDVSDGVNYFRYEGTLSGSAYTHASGYGYWDIIGHDPSMFVFGYPASDTKKIDLISKKVVFPTAINSAKLWVTYTKGIGVVVTPKVSIVANGQPDNFVNMVSNMIIDNGDGTIEESFSLSQVDFGTDVTLWLNESKPDTSVELAIKKYGLAVGV